MNSRIDDLREYFAGNGEGYMRPGQHVATLAVGDLMRMTVELVDTMKADAPSGTVTVRVQDIRALPDGTKMLWMENAE